MFGIEGWAGWMYVDYDLHGNDGEGDNGKELSEPGCLGLRDGQDRCMWITTCTGMTARVIMRRCCLNRDVRD